MAHGHPGGTPGGSGDSGDGPHSGGPGGRNYDRTPLIATWEVTQACDLECDHCRADAQPDRDPNELSTAEGKALIDQIADFGHHSPIFVISGGDPLKRSDLYELIDYATDQGLPTAVTPAPTPLLTRDVLETFADLGVKRIALSLDGASAANHDTFRGEDGSFDLIMERARMAKDAGLGIQINTTVTANTVEDLPAIADLVEELGAAMWEVFFLVPIGRGTELEQLDPAETVDVMEFLYERQKSAPYRTITVEAPHYRVVANQVEQATSGNSVRVGSTRAGKGFVFVSHQGDVFPSGFMPLTGGNVTETSLVDIYRDSDLFGMLRDDSQLTGSCGTCEHREICGGSRSRAYAATGNPMASDPLCPYVETLISGDAVGD
ncbi:MAG: radical SAM protein [Halodesulfurarchaeum sp.]|nr:radical SAM protein [Halodesulfurarchaeum sp.]